MFRPDIVAHPSSDEHKQPTKLVSRKGSNHLSGVRPGPKQQDMGRVSIPQLEPDNKNPLASTAYVRVPRLASCLILPCVPPIPALPPIPTTPHIPPVPSIQPVPECNPTVLTRVDTFGSWFKRNGQDSTPAFAAHGMSLSGGVYEMYRNRIGLQADQVSSQNQPATSGPSQPVAGEASQAVQSEVK